MARKKAKPALPRWTDWCQGCVQPTGCITARYVTQVGRPPCVRYLCPKCAGGKVAADQMTQLRHAMADGTEVGKAPGGV